MTYTYDLKFKIILFIILISFFFKALRDKKMPTALQLFEEIHTKKQGNENFFYDKRSNSVWVSNFYIINEFYVNMVLSI